MERKTLCNSLKDHCLSSNNMPKNPWNKMISGCSNGQIISNGSDQDHLCGFSWPPRSYSCSFCKREFRSAQALGGHMNVHRRDRARLRQSSPVEFYHQENYPILSLNPNPNPNANPSPSLVPSSTVLELDLKSKRFASEPTSSFIRVLDQDTDICRFRSCLNENGTVSMKDVGVDLLPGGRGDHYVDLELRLGRP